MSSITIRSARQLRATTLLMEASTSAQERVAGRDSRENQATRRPALKTAWGSASQKCDLPAPLGPQKTRFTARPIHSRVMSACGVGRGPSESSGRQLSKVFPEGEPAGPCGCEWRRVPGRRPPRRRGRAEPRRGPSAARVRWRRLRGCLAHVGQAHQLQEGGQLVGQGRRWRRLQRL